MTLVVGAVMTGSPRTAGAQCGGVALGTAPPMPRLIGSVRADSSRLGGLLGACWGDASLIRSSTRLDAPPPRHLELVAFAPRLDARWNSAIPVGGNDGAIWAGRGWSGAVSAGVRLRYRSLRVTVEPALVHAQNLPFVILPSGSESRSAFASPWRSGGVSADLPLRFGSMTYARIDPGESEIDFTHGFVSGGLASSSQWWGPGIRGGLVMSNNAAGIPRAYVRTSRPVVTKVGDFEGLWMLGSLLESPFFDYDTRNDLRSISAGVLTWRIAADTGLTIGAARAVYASVRRFGRVPGHFADVFIDWHRQSATAALQYRSDQLYSLFAWWRFPASGFSAHVEWAQLVPPSSLREVLVSPQKGQGYILGLEWADSTSHGTIRVQAEATMLEQTPEQRLLDVPEFYASRSVPQGYTNQGQVIGAAVGPGSSSQYLGIDLFRRAWRFTTFAERARIEETAYYRTISGIAGRAHDVALHGSAGVAYDGRWATWEASYTRTLRMNYLFQTVTPYFRGDQFDVRNNRLAIRVTPRLRPLR